jgi:hypothetical protein
MIKLIKELILVSGLARKKLGDFILRVFVLTKAATDNPLIAPDLDPTPLIMTGKATSLDTMVKERAVLEEALAAKTVKINELKAEITNDINNSWAPEAQKAVAGDIEKATLLAWHIKGVITGESKVVVGMAADSHPVINYIDNTNHLEHKVSIVNNITGNVAVPKDASRTEVYMQIGGTTPPDDISKMNHIGPARIGKLINTFDIADLGKIVYYMVVYINRKTQKPMIQSPVFSATIS